MLIVLLRFYTISSSCVVLWYCECPVQLLNYFKHSYTPGDTENRDVLCCFSPAEIGFEVGRYRWAWQFAGGTAVEGTHHLWLLPLLPRCQHPPHSHWEGASASAQSLAPRERQAHLLLYKCFGAVTTSNQITLLLPLRFTIFVFQTLISWCWQVTGAEWVNEGMGFTSIRSKDKMRNYTEQWLCTLGAALKKGPFRMTGDK